MQPNSARRFILARGKQRLGPYTVVQLTQMAATGMIQHSDMTLEEGQTKWQVAGTIEGIWPQALPLCSPRPDAIPRKREPWNPKRFGVVAFGVTAMMLVLLIGLWTIGNRGTRSSEADEKQHANVGDPGSEKRKEQENQLTQKSEDRERTPLQPTLKSSVPQGTSGDGSVPIRRSEPPAPSSHGDRGNGPREPEGRKKRLAELDKRLTEELAQINAKIEQKTKTIRELQRRARQLDGEVAKKVGGSGDFGTRKLMEVENELQKKGASFEERLRKHRAREKEAKDHLEWLKKMQDEQATVRNQLQSLNREIENLKSQALEVQERDKQARRNIEEENRVWTKQELDKLVAEHGTAEQAADNYIQGLINARRLEKATRIRTIPLQLTTGQFVEGSKKVDYQVRYVSEAGLVNQREGYVIVSRRVIAGRTFWFVSPVTVLQGIHLP